MRANHIRIGMSVKTSLSRVRWYSLRKSDAHRCLNICLDVRFTWKVALKFAKPVHRHDIHLNNYNEMYGFSNLYS